ncbi:MAG: TRAP transporter substrate-binding protein [Gammaproteobacteria bacterium]|nr:TRAP transporter substrate-binding protein [Gammaproteobacteria bacterium]
MVNLRAGLFAGAVALAATLAAPGASADLQKQHLKVVGTWHNLPPFYTFEKPFIDEQLGKLSGGKITGEINPITELGLKGFETARLTKIGVFDAVFGSYGYVASDAPEIEGADLSSISNDFASARKLVEAYEPVLEKVFAKKYGLKYLMSYPFPSQMIFCNADVTKLSDISGKKVRVYATTLGDFVEGLGGTSVTIPFAEVVPALQKGVADCGITGTMPAYNGKWHEVITHAMKVRVGMGLAFFAFNMKKWNSFNDETKAFFTEQANRLEDEMWVGAENEDEEALHCLTGSGPCSRGEPGKVVITEPNEADLKLRAQVLKEHVLKNWAARCSEQCVKDWNETAGKVAGMIAEK